MIYKIHERIVGRNMRDERTIKLLSIMNKLEPVIKLLKAFIFEGENGTSQSKAIESAIDEIFDDPDLVVDNFLDELSFYSPTGGDHLINYENFLPKAKKALEYFEALLNNA